MTPAEQRQRDLGIVEAAAAGEPIAKLAADHKLSVSRIQQILKKTPVRRSSSWREWLYQHAPAGTGENPISRLVHAIEDIGIRTMDQLLVLTGDDLKAHGLIGPEMLRLLRTALANDSGKTLADDPWHDFPHQFAARFKVLQPDDLEVFTRDEIRRWRVAKRLVP